MSDLTERLCEEMHDRYEAAAAAKGWETQQASRKPWADVPEANKATMRTAIAPIADEIERLEAENEILRRGFRASRRKNASYRTNSSRLPEWCHAALAAAVKIEPSMTEAGGQDQ